MRHSLLPWDKFFPLNFRIGKGVQSRRIRWRSFRTDVLGPADIQKLEPRLLLSGSKAQLNAGLTATQNEWTTDLQAIVVAAADLNHSFGLLSSNLGQSLSQASGLVNAANTAFVEATNAVNNAASADAEVILKGLSLPHFKPTNFQNIVGGFTFDVTISAPIKTVPLDLGADLKLAGLHLHPDQTHAATASLTLSSVKIPFRFDGSNFTANLSSLKPTLGIHIDSAVIVDGSVTGGIKYTGKLGVKYDQTLTLDVGGNSSVVPSASTFIISPSLAVTSFLTGGYELQYQGRYTLTNSNSVSDSNADHVYLLKNGNLIGDVTQSGKDQLLRQILLQQVGPILDKVGGKEGFIPAEYADLLLGETKVIGDITLKELLDTVPALKAANIDTPIDALGLAMDVFGGGSGEFIIPVIKKLLQLSKLKSEINSAVNNTSSTSSLEKLVNDNGFSLPIVDSPVSTILDILQNKSPKLVEYHIDAVEILADKYHIDVKDPNGPARNFYDPATGLFKIDFSVSKDDIIDALEQLAIDAAGPEAGKAVHFIAENSTPGLDWNANLEFHSKFQARATFGLNSSFLTAPSHDLLRALYVNTDATRLYFDSNITLHGDISIKLGDNFLIDGLQRVFEGANRLVDAAGHVIDSAGNALDEAGNVLGGILQKGGEEVSKVVPTKDELEDSVSSALGVKSLSAFGLLPGALASADFTLGISGLVDVKIRPGATPGQLTGAELLNQEPECFLIVDASLAAHVDGSAEIFSKPIGSFSIGAQAAFHFGSNCATINGTLQTDNGKGTGVPTQNAFAETLSVTGDTVYVYGSGNADHLTITGDGTNLYFTMDGVTQGFALDDGKRRLHKVIVDFAGKVTPANGGTGRDHNINPKVRSFAGGDDTLAISSAADATLRIEANFGNGKNFAAARGSDGQYYGGTVRFVGGTGTDIFIGGAGRSDLFGMKGGDSLTAGPGECYLDGGIGDDLLLGMQNGDKTHSTSTANGVIVGGGFGIKIVQVGSLSKGNFSIIGGTLDGANSSTDTNTKILVGGSGNDNLIAGDAVRDGGGRIVAKSTAAQYRNILVGGSGNDSLTNNAGRGVLIGGAFENGSPSGIDSISGGNSDSFVFLGNVLSSADLSRLLPKEFNAAAQLGKSETVRLGNGNNTVFLGPAGTNANVTLGNGVNSLLISSDQGQPKATTNGILGSINVLVGTGRANSVVIDDVGGAAGKTVKLESPSLSSLVLSGLTGLPITLGSTSTGGYAATGGTGGVLLRTSASGNTTVNIAGIPKNVTMNVISAGDQNRFNISSNAPTNTGNLDAIQGPLTIEAGSGGQNRLVLSDVGNSRGRTVTVTKDQFVGSGIAPITYRATGGAFTNGASNDGILFQTSNVGPSTVTVLSTLGGSTTSIQENGTNDLVNAGSTLSSNNGILDNLLGLLTVAGTGTNDQLYVNDHGTVLPVAPTRIDYSLLPTSITSVKRTSSAGSDRGIARLFAGINLLGKIASARVDGTDSPNTFDVSPSSMTEFTVDGNLPVPGSVPARQGDFLRLNVLPASGRNLTFTSPHSGDGRWTFTDGTRPVNFLSIERFNHVDVSPLVPPAGPINSPTSVENIQVLDSETHQVKFTIPASATFGTAYREGTQVATADVNGDGIPDIVVAPGRNSAPNVKVFDGVTGQKIGDFPVFSPDYRGGINVAVGNIAGDGWNDIVVSTQRGPSKVQIFNGKPGTDFAQIGSTLQPFPAAFIGGVSVAFADPDVNGLGFTPSYLVVGSGPGMPSSVQEYKFNTATRQLAFVGAFTPFPQAFRGGVNLSTGDLNGDGRADIIVSQGQSGTSIVNVFDSSVFTGGNALPIIQIQAFQGPANNSQVTTFAQDFTGDGVIDAILTAQGSDGRDRRIRSFNPQTGALVGQSNAQDAPGGTTPGWILQANTQVLLRAFNPTTGQHLLTTSFRDYVTAIEKGWQSEINSADVSFLTLSQAGTLPVHRLSNPVTGQNYLTTSNSELDAFVAVGWKFEKDDGFIYTTQVKGTVEVFTLRNRATGDYLYLSNVSEVNRLLSDPSGTWEKQKSLGFGIPIVVDRPNALLV